jgi:hypothetical protein
VSLYLLAANINDLVGLSLQGMSQKRRATTQATRENTADDSNSEDYEDVDDEAEDVAPKKVDISHRV